MLKGRMVSPEMDAAIALWWQMYQGRAPWQEQGGGMNLAAFVASEVARLATVEMDARMDGDARGRWLGTQFAPVLGRARVFVEQAAAAGTVALKPYVAGGAIGVDCVPAGRFFPTEVDAAGQVTGCLFVEQAKVDDRTFVRVEAHALTAEGVVIENRAYRVDGAGAREGRPVPLGSVARWADLAARVVLEGVRQPLFALLRMPTANTVDPQSPLGVSAFARAVDLIREADKQFERLLWEMESGERALYVDMRAFAAEDTEPGRLPVKRFYRTMDADPAGDALFAEWSPKLRVDEHLRALNEILQRVEDACALARGTLSEAPESSARGARTATELKIMRQRTYALVRDTQKAVERALRQLVGAMDVWATVAGLCVEGEWTLMVHFDDSVVSDRSEAFAERVKLVELGVMGVEELRSWYFGKKGSGASERFPASGGIENA